MDKASRIAEMNSRLADMEAARDGMTGSEKGQATRKIKLLQKERDALIAQTGRPVGG